ncbi:hypothetical protein L6452_35553 [Arctium lappa]|uniref:Uncharacterized protein n=1 Tax=Arctium lappa TaxID=4217 RepID=A0ACB8Y7A7_ARCLA|nr:hypothetical protein L6452_35553 [Arctium lappa]
MDLGQRQVLEIRGSDSCWKSGGSGRCEKSGGIDRYRKSVAATGIGNQGDEVGIEEASVISDFSDMPGIEESSDISIDMEVPCLPHVVEIVPSRDNMYQPIGLDEQAEIIPVADSKFEMGVSNSSTYPPTTYFLDL